MPPLIQPVVAVDVVLLCLRGGHLAVLLQTRAEPPFQHALALPGVALHHDESLLDAARRALALKTGLPHAFAAQVHMEQLATFDALHRDPRGRTLSVAHVGLAAEAPDLGESLRSLWKPVAALAKGTLPFDHDDIVRAALDRLRGKLRYTNIAARLLPEVFRLDDLQGVYEAIVGRRFNRANFRTKLLRIGLIEQAGVVVHAPGAKGGRPPHLYRFKTLDVASEARDFL